MKEKCMSTFKALKLTIVLLVLLLPWMQAIAFPADTSDDDLSANDETVIAMDLFNEPHPTPATRVENPFTEARDYINPYYSAKVLIEAQSTGGSLGAGLAKVADYTAGRVRKDASRRLRQGAGYPREQCAGYAR